MPAEGSSLYLPYPENFFDRGRLYYLFGNHDVQYQDWGFAGWDLSAVDLPYQKERFPLFPGIKVHEGLVLVHKKTGGRIFITHGHQGERLNTRFWKLSKFLLLRVWRPLQLLRIRNPFRVANNPDRQQKISLQIQDWIKANNQPLICGHTHQAHFSYSGEIPYFNTGSCIHPRWITEIEIEDGEIRLIKWRVRAESGGLLAIHRDLVYGPERICVYFTDPQDINQEFPFRWEQALEPRPVLENTRTPLDAAVKNPDQ